jgi:MFS family permease
VFVATDAPQLVFSMWGGVLADRFDRRRLIVATSVLMVAGLSYQVLAVVFTTDVLADGVTSVGEDYLGRYQAAIGVGAIAGVLLTAGPAQLRRASCGQWCDAAHHRT